MKADGALAAADWGQVVRNLVEPSTPVRGDRIFALIGAGVTSMSVALLSALAGTWLYGALQTRLPH